MPTFIELLQAAETAQSKLTIINHLIEYIDENFRPVAGAEAKQKLLDSRNVPIAPVMFETVVTDVLLVAQGSLTNEIASINTANLAVQEPEVKTKKGKADTTQGASK
jgi:hypothetical protein